MAFQLDLVQEDAFQVRNPPVFNPIYKSVLESIQITEDPAPSYQLGEDDLAISETERVARLIRRVVTESFQFAETREEVLDTDVSKVESQQLSEVTGVARNIVRIKG